ncbi:MAG: hypothetical protein ACOX17_07895 [Christensenellales bacterium]|jgi:hypothetical protein
MKFDWRFLIRLLIAQVLFAVMTYFLLYSTLGVLEAVDIFHWAIMLLLLGIYFYILYVDSKIKGSNDMGATVNAEKEYANLGKDSTELPKAFCPWKGFLYGFLSQIPVLLFILVMQVLRWCALGAAYSIEVLLKYWFFCLTTLFSSFPTGVIPIYVYLAMVAWFILAVGMGYRAGEAHRRHIEVVIQRNSQRIRKGHKPEQKK